MTPEQLISPEYQALLQRQHTETKWGADKGYRHLNEVMEVITLSRSKTVLDYGSGRESLRTDLEPMGFPVACYDPGTSRTALPGPADLVVCGDVLEHIEHDKLDAVLEHIFSLAQRAVYLIIALRQAKAPLVDGSPAHLIVEDSAWWMAKLQPNGRHGEWIVKRSSAVEGKEMKVWLTKRVVA
jgi:Methyltransferase domain